MKILAYSLGQMQANCYFLVDGQNCLIIDPADEASFILEELQIRKLKLLGMLATHGHFDHIMAVGEIQLSYNVPLYLGNDDLFLVKRLNETAKYFLGYDPNVVMPTNIKHFKENQLEIGNLKLKIIYTPGHTPGSVCYYFEQEKTIFTGDTLFKQGIGRYDFSYSDKNKLDESLKDLLKLPEDTKVYAGHGEETDIKVSSEFLRFHFFK